MHPKLLNIHLFDELDWVDLVLRRKPEQLLHVIFACQAQIDKVVPQVLVMILMMHGMILQLDTVGKACSRTTKCT